MAVALQALLLPRSVHFPGITLAGAADGNVLCDDTDLLCDETDLLFDDTDLLFNETDLLCDDADLLCDGADLFCDGADLCAPTCTAPKVSMNSCMEGVRDRSHWRAYQQCVG